jgi:hypothetical protein
MKKEIRLFMWGYQSHFRINIESKAESIFEALGVSVDIKALLVGARKPGSSNPNPVCVEPEDGQWSVELFDGLLDSIETEYDNHDLQNMFYGDRPSMERKPEVMRRDSTRRAVKNALFTYDRENRVKSFCGTATPVGDYYVVPVIQVPQSVLNQNPSMKLTSRIFRNKKPRNRSPIYSAMAVLLDEASNELNDADAGAGRGRIRQAKEIVRSAASNYMYSISGAMDTVFSGADLFERLNSISSLMYEGAEGVGSLILASSNSSHITYTIRFKEPIPFREHRWARKALEMALEGTCLIADSDQIYGLGTINVDTDNPEETPFTVHFLDHYHWEIRRGTRPLLVSRYGEPRLPREPVHKDLLVSNYSRLFPSCTYEDIERIWNLLIAATQQSHGCMIVVAADAKQETERLAQQGTAIEPALLTDSLLRCVSGIDGSIILDPTGVCLAIGVILDGPATPECTPSRGSRFNSGLRYVRAGTSRRLAIVVSDDHTVDIIPTLRPIVCKSQIEEEIRKLESATLENYHKPRNWIDQHRFYFDESQCARANATLDRIEKLPRDVGQLVIHTPRLRVHADLDPIYLDP